MPGSHGLGGFIRTKSTGLWSLNLLTLDKVQIAWPCVSDMSFKCLTYQLSTVG